MLKTKVILFCISIVLFLTACSPVKQLNVSVANSLSFDRNEVVNLNAKQLKPLLKHNSKKNIRVKDISTGLYLSIQWIDFEKDNAELLFQAAVKSKSASGYVVVADSTVVIPKSKAVAYSRFVPERTDDYTWENDKVAFRTYGPDAQQRTEQHRPDGTLSSGIDLWLKRTDNSIINKWYAEAKKKPGYYHTDHGEGYDPYHVGASRGTGGSGVWVKDSLQVSKNFIRYKTIAAGPLRTVFELNYASWSEFGVHETKRISLDLGSNFSKFEVMVDADKPLPNYTVGITLHNNKGKVNINKQMGWFSHHEIIDNVFIGEGIVIDPKVVDTAFANKSKTPDQSNLLVITQPKNKTITYYAGFAWAKSGQVKSITDWNELLQKQAEIIANPLEIIVKQ